MMSETKRKKIEQPNNGERYQPMPFDRVVRKLVNTPPKPKQSKQKTKKTLKCS